jgi:hypothetical protein
MTYVNTEDHRVAREIESRGLLSTNNTELKNNRAARARQKELRNQLQSNEQKFRDMGTRLDRCEHLLTELVRHISRLVAANNIPE